MSLNIKNEHVHHLAREAAARTGKTQTGAIEAALEHYLATLPPRDTHDPRRRIDAILSDVDVRLAGRGLDTDDLYDDRGLPA